MLIDIDIDYKKIDEMIAKHDDKDMARRILKITRVKEGIYQADPSIFVNYIKQKSQEHPNLLLGGHVYGALQQYYKDHETFKTIPKKAYYSHLYPCDGLAMTFLEILRFYRNPVLKNKEFNFVIVFYYTPRKNLINQKPRHIPHNISSKPIWNYPMGTIFIRYNIIQILD